jgi:type IV pilus assembly protein PilA
LAAVALPTYQDYAVRARVSKLLVAASAARTTITENAQYRNGLASSNVSITIATGGKISATAISGSGVITLNGADAVMGTSGIVVRLTPSWNATQNTVNWSRGVTPVRYEPSSCRNDKNCLVGIGCPARGSQLTAPNFLELGKDLGSDFTELCRRWRLVRLSRLGFRLISKAFVGSECSPQFRSLGNA